MRIVIDMQGAQSASRHRGIGRLTLSLIKALVENKGDHEVILALNGLFPDTIEFIRSTFDRLLSQENIRVWQAVGPVYYLASDSSWRRRTAELLRESFFASLKPDIILITSLFEGLGDDAVTSIGSFNNSIPTAVILYDLIPLIYRELYLKSPEYELWYEQKIGHLRRADLLLSISESSRQEAIQYLGIASDSTVNISAAVDTEFKRLTLEPSDRERLLNQYGISHSFVMYTGAAIEPRKNIEGLIRAYAQLPKYLRREHQLVIVCTIQPVDRERLVSVAKKFGMGSKELVLTGYVPDEDLINLYNLCKAFVFPSWHEGFGLPVLEAMSCGAAVIGSNTSSVPEIIDRKDALFDPKDDRSITDKLEQVLTDEEFLIELQRHSVKQAEKFSWDLSAKRAIQAMESISEKNCNKEFALKRFSRRPKLAYISPLPPVRSGISDYSAELLPELARYYEIEVIVDQETVSDPWIIANCPIRNSDWFLTHAKKYDRVLYHFGNSPFHQYMLSLLNEIPGVVVLHDFFLSGIYKHFGENYLSDPRWLKELYYSHGYKAIQEHASSSDLNQIIMKYPCNLSVIQRAQSIIVHSDFSRRLAQKWYYQLDLDNWVVIPHLRAPKHGVERTKARRKLSLNEDDFVISSFGLLDPTKLNHRLLQSWLNSRLADDEKCILIFVGENHGGGYGEELIKNIRESGLNTRIHITGWVDTKTFQNYLAASDIAVQLRTLSRGETSGTVLDCMAHGIPTIINANGSMADLPDGPLYKLSDEFENVQLQDALETLWLNSEQRREMGKRVQEIIYMRHLPRVIARQYSETIENSQLKAAVGIQGIIKASSNLRDYDPDDNDYFVLANAISQNHSYSASNRQILVDISALVINDLKTGIERVVRGILKELIFDPPMNYRIEPVYATTEHPGYRYARHFTLNFLGCSSDIISDELIEFHVGDVFIGLDLQQYVVSAQEKFLKHIHHNGVRTYFVVYDLLPILMQHAFPRGADVAHETWLKTISQFDGAICISSAVADELKTWLHANGTDRLRPYKITWSHLGADVENSIPSKGVPDNADQHLTDISRRVSFLMVGTVEPRKGYMQTVLAFERLWTEDMDVNLIIVGKQGWMVETLIEKIRKHPELNRRLLWLEGISDEYLEKIYASSNCLIAASEGEGFGLPLIEAAQHKLPIIARDIPVFREVAGEHAFYFHGKDPIDLASAIKDWIKLYDQDMQPKSDDMHWLTWKEAAKNMLDILLE
ncbi:glycosyltransferase [Ferroacidibacillus organovorans]|uniref:Glycosyl transferase family 1 n=1 Tax=Ferroacidibacillus organovorans TaxID=1765683 RepID=A0A101XPJ1_9BACL|nr:glycosyltransferase [Ferroacidibacillus organovorans]KUO95218.1 glycosyl transferase family 1 [Ferroacidibacillus organovorans]